LVTAIAPDNARTPSAAIDIARLLNSESTIHGRTFAHADALIESLDPATFDAWLILEDAAKARKLLVEVIARNDLYAPDALGERRDGVIEEDGPATITVSLWTKTVLWVPSLAWHVSKDAGGEVANYLLFRSLRLFPHQRIGLVRVPPANVLDAEKGMRILVSLLERCVAVGLTRTALGRLPP
jgi:hypothetical protein